MDNPIYDTTSKMLFVDKIIGVRKTLYKDDYEGCYKKLGEWLANKMKKMSSLWISKVTPMHSYDYVSNMTYVQLEVSYEGF